MHWLFIGLAIIIILFLIVVFVLFLQIYVKVHYSWKGKEQDVQVSIFLAKFKLIHKHIPLQEIDDSAFMEDIDEKLDMKMDSLLKTTRKILKVLKTVLKHTKLHQLEWSTQIGTGEASTTGIASGILWSLKGTIVGYFVEKIILLCNPTVQVNPEFQQANFQTNLDCIVSIRLGKAIQGFIKLTRIIKAK